MSRLYLHRESATLRADFSEEGIQMKKQLWGLFCAAVLAATLALPVRAAEQTHRAYLCGYPDGTIRPNARITRAQLACALVRLAEEPLPEPTRVTFFDVPGDHWACTQIRQLAGLGLLPFGEGGWFLPSATVSWRELCSVLDTLAGSETGCEAFPALTAAWSSRRGKGVPQAARRSAVQSLRVHATACLAAVRMGKMRSCAPRRGTGTIRMRQHGIMPI